MFKTGDKLLFYSWNISKSSIAIAQLKAIGSHVLQSDDILAYK